MPGNGFSTKLSAKALTSSGFLFINETLDIFGLSLAAA